MKEFYYQIKGKKENTDDPSGYGNWTFPPIFTGKVIAEDKKKAKESIHEEYGVKFPTRVLRKDIDSNEFLLSIEEIKPGSHIEKLFQPQKCEQCGNTFYVIDKYNDKNCTNKGFTFCSEKCHEDNGKVSQFKRMDNDALIGGAIPVIYKITNKTTGKCYIGKTSQVFTLRWYQHFFQLGTNKFHDAIKNSKVSDWLFEIQEIIIFPEHIREEKNMYTYLDVREKYITERERHWINHYNSIEDGYNSI